MQNNHLVRTFPQNRIPLSRAPFWEQLMERGDGCLTRDPDAMAENLPTEDVSISTTHFLHSRPPRTTQVFTNGANLEALGVVDCWPKQREQNCSLILVKSFFRSTVRLVRLSVIVRPFQKRSTPGSGSKRAWNLPSGDGSEDSSSRPPAQHLILLPYRSISLLSFLKSWKTLLLMFTYRFQGPLYATS